MTDPFNRHERISFLIFLALCLLTVLSTDYFMIPALAGILWGFFGFLRLAYLCEVRFPNLPKSLTLSSALIFGLHREQSVIKDIILRRLESPDVLLWFVLATLTFLWGIYNSLDPFALSLGKTLQFSNGMPVDFPLSQAAEFYGLTLYTVSSMMVGIIVVMALSFSQNRIFLARFLPFYGAALLVAFLALFFLHPIANPAFLPDLSIPKGAGLGMAAVIFHLDPALGNHSATALFTRMIDLGSIGALAPYILFLPAIFVLMAALFTPGRSRLRPLMGFAAAFMLGFCDIFFLQSVWQQSFSLMALVFFVLCWGMAGRKY